MRYTIEQFNREFPYDVSCLDIIFQNRYGDLEACPKCGVVKPKFYHVKLRKSYACGDCGHQLYPLAGTIFNKSTTPLRKWFYAMYLFSVSRNGVASLELQRHLGVSYKTAHRMAKQIRSMMGDNTGKFKGIVEIDETYIGGRAKQDRVMDNKTPVLGIVSKAGKIKTKIVNQALASTMMPFIYDSVERGSMIHTDESKIYVRVVDHYNHESVRHVSHKWVENGVHTNTIESFWGQLKRSIDGTYHAVSPRYLGSYVDEFGFRFNHRNVAIFPILIERAAKPS